MFYSIENEILGMSRIDYLVMYLVMAAVLLALLYYSFHAFRRFRFMTGTATSKIRSAAQGLCLLYTSPSPRDGLLSRMPSSA